MNLMKFIPPDRQSNVLIIKKFLADNGVGSFSIVEAYYLWECFSDSQCANWLDVNETTLNEFESFVKEY